ncbi:kinesin-like protein KIF20B isoform X1 [Pangasianodon hypophthalmus]|uniref:kinesin-like protein KIF20B isoform X1 n=1 Tax=Pangasianodon hypophthalmus TaxID=310915 RepID=UPI002306F47E|nr:kinesin-like protein KIF20B isoform X1 [Pangasianodon hypophthalmus]XP_034165334.2 kinesin-like protein KIF20B isoform X1 [Pangasianodon hypophthalmus]
MESCLNYKPERVGSVTVEDLRKDLFTEFSKIPASQEPVFGEKEHLQVYLRIRPLSSTESELGESQDCISVELPDTVVLKAPRLSLTARQSEKLGPQLAQRFQFSKVYGPETTQRQMFDGTTKALVKDVLGGENSLVFTYGVTNAGKTFTFLGPESDGGILPRSLNVIFNSIVGRVYTQNNIKPHRCVDFTRLTKDQQEEEAKIKKSLLRRLKENDLQKSTSSMSSSASSTLLEGSSYGELDEDSLCLEEDSHVKFSVWVSFCEIYNENIHDLLDFASNTSHRRSVLRLCQDVKGNTFVKELTWVQVNSADEAYKILKIGRKNQSFSSTKLNSVSSRSHSIFSIRILRIEDVGVPRVQTISELSLCDLAGSERCAKTQNRGDRLKEAGNINTSLLTLGKCMNALRLSQTQSKFQQHIPFRESKLTHYLQGFFCGRGKACMIVNINQCASMYDETLNVLKFSAVAQKVVVLNPKPVLSVVPKKSAREVSMMINNVDRREWTRRSTLIGWETSLEDVQEDEDDEEMEVDEEEEEESGEESMVENTVLEAAEDQELGELQQKIKELTEELSKEQSEKMAMESRIREEVTTEFMELFSNMEKDYSERLQREKEIAEERAERRLEILKNLVNKNDTEMATTSSAEDGSKEIRVTFLDGMIEEMQNDLAKIKRDAEAAQTCLESTGHSPRAVSKLRTQLDEMTKELLKNHQLLDIKTKEMEEVQVCLQNSSDQLLEANKNYENQKLRNQQLLELCQEKDEMISKLQTALDQNVEAANEDRAYIDSIKEEIVHYRNNCKCMLNDAEEKTKDQEIQQLAEALKEKNDYLAELKHERHSLDQKLKDLTEDLKQQGHACDAALSLLETEKAATAKLTNENRALVNELGDFQQAANDMKSRLTAMETELSIKTTEAAKLSEELQKAQVLLQKHQEEATEQSQKIKSLKLEAENLRQKLSAQELSEGQTNKCVFQETIAALRRECETVMSMSQEKSRRIMTLEQEVSQIREEMCQKQTLCNQLEQERGAQREEKQHLLGRYEAEKLIVEQLKRSHSELETELLGVRQQLAVLEEQQQAFTHSSKRVGELEKKLSEKEAHCADLEQRLLQTQNKLNQAEERDRQVESSLKKRRKEVEDSLVHKNAELEIKAQELLQSKKQVNDGLDTIKRLGLDLDQKEKRISDLLSQLTESNAETEQMQKEIATLSEEVSTLQQKLCDLEKDRDQALSAVAKKEQIIEQLKTDQANKAESLRHHETCQELLAKERLIEEMCRTLSDEKRSRTEQERLLEARLNEIESLSGELMKLKESCQRKSVTESGPDHSHHEEQKIKKASVLLTQTSVHESSVLSTEGEREKRFPKPELEISFTPLKPDRLNIRRPGDDESVTVKIKRTARKRKSAEIENSVESENRKNMRLRGNSRANIQRVESPTVLGKKANQLKQKDSPVSLKGSKDRTLQKIGDFIQSSPTLLGSKAKKIMAKVALKSPEPENNTETSSKPKRSKRKLFKTQISSPLDIPSHPIIGMDQDNKESDHLIIKRKLRARTAK